jgi:VWFA-related protein
VTVRWSAVCCFWLVVGAAVFAAQEPPQPSSTPTPVFRAATAVVTVDVVVRDGSGRPVTTLAAEQFEVFEDDVPQAVTSFRAPAQVSRTTQRTDATAAAPAATTTPLGSPALVALVFDRLSNQGRAMAHRAALNFVGSTPTLPHTIGVYFLDLRLEQLQDFTRDRVRVAAAIDAAASRASWQFGAVPGAFEGDGEQALLRADPGRGSGADPFLALERDQLGFRTMDQLRQVVTNLSLVPGRKSVVLFSEGLALSVNVEPRFQALLDEANRANVAFYTIDAAGLRSVSTQRRTTLDTRDAAEAAQRVSTSDITGSALGLLESNADAILNDPASSMGRLAGDTGGFVVQHTNDLETGFRRISEDLESHYVLTYSPTNDAYDGKFRRIGVRVREPGLRVIARRGYTATPPTTEVAPALSFEAQALAALDTTPVPNDFPHVARALQFPGRDGRTRLAVLAETDTKHLAYATSGDGTRFSAEAVVVVRVRDLRGQVAAKASEVYALGGDAANRSRSQEGRLLFFRAPDLPAGSYTVETVVHDTQAGRSSVRFSTVDVPAVPAGAPQFGDLFVVAAAEVADEAGEPSGTSKQQPASPLRFGRLLLYPQLSPSLTSGERKELAFAFVVANAARVQSAQVDVWRGGAPLGTVPLTLDAPDASGTVRQIFRLPMDTFTPGSYDVRVSLRTADATLTRNTRFTVR